jgi:hypothetical protein
MHQLLQSVECLELAGFLVFQVVEKKVLALLQQVPVKAAIWRRKLAFNRLLQFFTDLPSFAEEN